MTAVMLDRPTTTTSTSPWFSNVGPNWFAAAMGTGIVANAAASLPFQVPGLLVVAKGIWLLDVVILATLLTATSLHWARNPVVARGHLEHPVMANFYGAPAMALMTVGAGALLLGKDLIGVPAALALAAVLWLAGTALGLFTAVVVPYKAITKHRMKPDAAFGGWLMPVVPPMVSAATGPLFLPHLPAGQWRLSLLVCCYAMFGLTLLASLLVIAMIWTKLILHGVGAAAAVPALFIVLGPIGQSITAAHNLGQAAPAIVGESDGQILRVSGLLYGLPMWGFAVLWLALASALTLRVARTEGLPFTLTWWSFTFPVGTVVTGTSGLAVATGSTLLGAAAGLLYVGLAAAWLTVGARTLGLLRARV
ncbi:TDT family transporter [Kribbella deserti]|uniref:TDT family transporter n=1 Tax=Kribbella deserti TaxID=1926257 RepID=A0ABV6QCV1_9ACTN